MFPFCKHAVNRSLLSFEYKICRFSISMTICAFITIKSNHRSITQPLLSVHYIPDPTTNCRKKAFSFSAHFKAPLFGVNWIRVLEKCIKYKHGLKSNRRDSEFNCRQKTKPHESWSALYPPPLPPAAVIAGRSHMHTGRKEVLTFSHRCESI